MMTTFYVIGNSESYVEEFIKELQHHETKEEAQLELDMITEQWKADGSDPEMKLPKIFEVTLRIEEPYL